MVARLHMPALAAALAAAATLLSACDATIHEYPELDLNPQAFELRLTFDTELPLYRTVDYSRGAAAASAGRAAVSALSVRHQVAAYRADARGQFSTVPDTLAVVVNPAAGTLDTAVAMKLRPGAYRFIAWSDYVEPGSDADRLYATADFSAIAIASAPEAYHGCDDTRDAFRGTTTATVVSGAATAPPDGQRPNVAVVNMQRPMAKYAFIATDLQQLLDEQGPDALNAVRVVVRYDYFMPYSYSLHTMLPIDSWWGVAFEGAITPLTNDEVELGFDYVFVGDGETSVQASVYVYSKADGALLSNSQLIDVPLMRSMLTEVRGRFFTEGPSGGVIVDPGFNGKYDIEIK